MVIEKGFEEKLKNLFELKKTKEIDDFVFQIIKNKIDSFHMHIIYILKNKPDRDSIKELINKDNAEFENLNNISLKIIPNFKPFKENLIDLYIEKNMPALYVWLYKSRCEL